MSLLRRRIMMIKQSDFQLIEVENVTFANGAILDDAREVGFLLETPYHLRLSSIANYMYVHLLTDADFVCMDRLDNDSVMVDRNLYIPAIGKYGVGNVPYPANVYADGSIGNNAVSYSQYPRYAIYDSLGRKWIKVEINGAVYNDESVHKHIEYNMSQDFPIYYCTENNLGKVFPERRWDKHYYVERNLIVVNNRDKKVTNNYFDGLKYHATEGVILQTTPNNAPASYEGNIEGYLIEIPNNADQVQVFYQGTRSYVARITNDLEVIEIGWNQNSYLYTPIEGDKYLAFTPEYPENITTLYMLSWTEW